VIGKSGSEVDALRKDLHRMTRKQIKVNILEIKRPELDANLVASRSPSSCATASPSAAR
jgi:small subunit ribosomal protein S3